MTGFSSLTTALASLNAQRYALDITGQNIANGGTAGYTRQRVDLASVNATVGVSQLYATPVPTGGVTVAGTSRMNDPVLDARARMEHGQNGMLQTKQTTLSSVEGLFNEPSDTGLSEQLNAFWKSWNAVALNPKDPAARNVVLQQAAGVASSLNTTSAALSRVTQGVSDQLTAATQQINSAASALATVNGSMAVATATGVGANSLADQRDTLMQQLADLTGGQATIQPDGTATVLVGGQTLVSGVTANAAAIGPGNTLTVGGAPTTGVTGQVGGLITGLNVDLPNYQSQLDGVAAALASTVNAAQTAGFDPSGAAGGPLFSGTTAATIAVAVTNPMRLAASGVPGGNLDASVASSLAGFATLAGGASSAYSSMIGILGSQVQAATQSAAVQQSVTTNVDALRESQSGVNLDEETTNLLTFQRAYQASSRVLTTVDETLDTLINHTGRTGL